MNHAATATGNMRQRGWLFGSTEEVVASYLTEVERLMNAARKNRWGPQVFH
jgi:hypothetical protein